MKKNSTLWFWGSLREQEAGWKKVDGVQPDTEFVCSDEDDDDGDDDVEDDDDEDILPLTVLRDRLNLPDSMSFDDYVDVDKDVETTETVTEQTILADLLNLHEEEEDGEETRELNPICSLSDAKNHLEEIRRYFL